jgi:putative peptidoglycan lipid II flippase
MGIPASIALVVLSESLITTLFYRGKLTAFDVQMASYSLSAYGIGLLGHMLVKVLAPGYFSRQDTSTPVRYAIVALVSNMILNLILVWHLKHVGLALATSLSAFLNAGLLWYGLKKAGVLTFGGGWGKFSVQIVVANFTMLGFLLVFVPGQSDWLDMGLSTRMMTMLAICAGGGFIYAACLGLVGVRLKQILR